MKLGDKVKKAAVEHVKQKAARDILNNIEEWRSNRVLTAKRRWIFELIQNAIDTAMARQNDSLKIEIQRYDNSIIFKHNGGYFNLDEISAVIYGGSTKPYAPESEYMGRFGTGFLVTHIVNRKVKIKGYIKENEEQIYRFKLDVNREGNAENEISQNIESCFSQLNDATPLQTSNHESWTEFIYCSDDSLGKEAIDVGIHELKENLPFIFAFNNVHEITIDEETFTGKTNENQNIIRVEVGKDAAYVKQDTENGLQVGVLVKDGKVSSLRKRPKIFIGMPLTESADYINVPFVINSIKFDSTKERDALVSDSEKNKELLNCSFRLYYELLNEIIETGNIRELFYLVDFQLILDNEVSQNPLWGDFNGYLKETLERIVKEVPLVNATEEMEKIEEINFPSDKLNGKQIEEETFRKFYELIVEIKKNIPVIEELHSWIKIVEQLKKIFPEDIKFYTIEDTKKELEDFVGSGESLPDFDDLREKYNLSDAKQFIIKFFEIINSLYEKEIIPQEFIKKLLPTQDGFIGGLDRIWTNSKISFHLFLEDPKNPIPDELKDIAKKIGRPIKDELVNNDFSSFEIIKDYVRDLMSVEKILENLLSNDYYKLPAKVENWEDEKVEGWMELFRWCVIKNKLANNFPFPIITKNAEVQVLEDLDKEAFFIPFKYKGIKEEYEEIYPENRILHQKYFEIDEMQEKEFVDALQDHKAFVRSLPIYKKEVSFGYNKLKSILCNTVETSKVNHKVEAEMDIISVLPFWNEVIGKISDYPDRAKLLFRFMIEYIIEKDRSWEDTINVNCSCKDKSHKIIPSHWLASLKTDAWVPSKIVENEEEKPVKREATKESIENLFSSSEFRDLIKINSEDTIRLLPHFGFDSLDLNVKLHSVKTEKDEKVVRDKVSELVGLIDVVDATTITNVKKLAVQDPVGFREAIEKFKEKLKKEPIKEENKKIGANVEILIKKIINDKGLNVKSIYKGGDLEIWPEENEGWDSGLIELEPPHHLIEIKFTLGTRVHLSKVQSKTARDKKEYYIVLVVGNAGDLRERLKMDIDENVISEDMIDTIIENSHIIEGIHTKLGSIPNPEEVEPDINGYWIKRKLWGGKNGILTWIEEKFGDGV